MTILIGGQNGPLQRRRPFTSLKESGRSSLFRSSLRQRHHLRFSELERLIDGVNQKMLIQQLKQLEKDGIVERTAYPEVPPRVEYTLGKLGIALGPSMEALIEWAEMRRRLRDEVTTK